MSAPVGATLRVTRVIDQDADFLRYAEQCELVPGREVIVESHDSAGDTLRLRSATGRRRTLAGADATKVLVRADVDT
jgi:hypothetical protein